MHDKVHFLPIFTKEVNSQHASPFLQGIEDECLCIKPKHIVVID